MNAKLSPGLLVIALVLASLIGPLTEMQAVKDKPELIADVIFWRDIGAAFIGSFATSALTLIALLGTTLGLPALFTRWQAPDKPAGSP